MATVPATESLKGRVAFITGASRSIGKVIALALAREGVNIVIAAKSTESTEKLPGSIYDTAKEVEALGAKALPLVCNVRNVEEIDAMRGQDHGNFRSHRHRHQQRGRAVVEADARNAGQSLQLGDGSERARFVLFG